ncbi:MAG: hypothetical protein ABSC06_18990 [Rhodopila sp.]
MSISSISAGSLAADIQQMKRAADLGAGPQTTVMSAANASLGAAAPPSGSTKPQGQVHHRRGGDNGPSPQTDGNQSGTVSAGGSKSVNTLA